MNYIEVIHLIKHDPNIKLTRECWLSAYIMQDPNDETNIIYHRDTVFDNTNISTEQKYYPCMSDIAALDWKEYVSE